MPDGRAIQDSETARLPWNKLRDKTRECDIIPSFKHNSLVSVENYADAEYYTLHSMYASWKGNTSLRFR